MKRRRLHGEKGPQPKPWQEKLTDTSHEYPPKQNITKQKHASADKYFELLDITGFDAESILPTPHRGPWRT